MLPTPQFYMEIKIKKIKKKGSVIIRLRFSDIKNAKNTVTFRAIIHPTSITKDNGE